MRILDHQIEMDLFVHVIEKRAGGGKNKNMNRSEQAQQFDDVPFLRFGKSGGRIGIGGVHTMVIARSN